MLVTNINLLAYFLGILSLIGLALTLGLLIFNIFKISQKYQKQAIAVAKVSLFLTIFLGLVHGLLMTQKLEIDFYNLNTYWVYAAGLFSLNLLISIAFSFAELKNNWKKLTYFIYALLFLLSCHIWQQVTRF